MDIETELHNWLLHPPSREALEKSILAAELEKLNIERNDELRIQKIQALDNYIQAVKMYLTAACM